MLPSAALLQDALRAQHPTQLAANDPMVSMEADGKTQREREYVIYAKIEDFEELKKAESFEEQEQWEIRPPRSDANQYFGGIRVRKIVKGKTTTYVLTAKTMVTEGADKAETEIDVSKDLFDQFKRLTTGGMIKTRYFFPVKHEGQDLVWEIDVYKDPDGKDLAWCKIDLEVGKKLDALPDYPIKLSGVIDAQPADRTAEEKAKVQELLDKNFISPNPFPKVKPKA